MTTIVTRIGKGSPLTNNEMDTNLTNINTDKLEKSNNLSELTNATTALINLGERTGATGSLRSPAGTTAQRDGTPAAGYLRFNVTLNQFEGYNGTVWAPMGGDASFRNKIINGNMLIAQRTPNGTAPINQHTPTLDRWIIDPVGGPVDWGRGYTPFTISGFPLGSLRATAGVGATGMNMRQRIESVNAYMLAQKKVTVSFYVYGNGTTGATCTPSLAYANSSDNFSAITLIQSGNAVPIINNIFTKHSFTFNALPDAVTQGMQLTFSFYGLSQGQSVALGGVQLEEGEFATSFEHRPYGTELALCQRYFEIGQAVMLGAAYTNMSMSVNFKQTKRVAPTVSRTNDWFSSVTAGSSVSASTPEGFTFTNGTVNAVGVGGEWQAWAEL